MSILLKGEIIEAKENGSITIDPYTPEYIGPNSYDVRLSEKLLIYDFSEIQYLDCKQENPVKTICIPEDGFVLQPGVLYLGSTIETIGSKSYIPMYEGRSSMARLGIQSHLSAGFGDIGFCRQWTLEITVVHPVKVYSGMRIGQVYFHKVSEDYNTTEHHYQGKYTQQTGPQASLAYKDDYGFNHSSSS